MLRNNYRVSWDHSGHILLLLYDCYFAGGIGVALYLQWDAASAASDSVENYPARSVWRLCISGIDAPPNPRGRHL